MHRERPIAFEGDRHEAVIAKVRVVAMMIARCGLEQLDIEDQGKRSGALRRAYQPRAGVHRADLAFDAAEALLIDPVAFVDQDGVGMAELVVGPRALKNLGPEMLPIAHTN